MFFLRRTTIRLISLDTPIVSKCFLAKNIYTVDHKTLLLSRGTIIDEYYRQRLLDLGYQQAYAVDHYTVSDKGEEVVNDETYNLACNLVYDVLENPDSVNNPETVSQLHVAAYDLVSSIFKAGKNALYSQNNVKTYENYIYLHSVNVAVLGAMIGRELRAYP